MGRRGMPAARMSAYRRVTLPVGLRAFRFHLKAWHQGSWPVPVIVRTFRSADNGPADPVVTCSAPGCLWMVDVILRGGSHADT